MDSTAYHEAGHAVVAWVLKFPVVKVTIVPEIVEDERGYWALLGCCVHKSRTTQYRGPEDPALRDRQEKLAIVAMAGPIAQGLYLGVNVRPDPKEKKAIEGAAKDHHGGWTWAHLGSDEEENARLREDCRRKHLAWLRARTLVLLQDWWPLVDALAVELLEKKTLTGRQVRKLFKEAGERVRDEVYPHRHGRKTV